MNIDIYMTLESCYETLLQKITDACILFRDLRWSWSAFLPLFVEAVRVSAIERKKNNTFLENCQLIKRISPSCHDWIMLTLSLLMRLCESVRSVSVVVVKQRCELAPSCRRSGRERQAFRRVHHDEPVEVLQLCSVSADIGIVR